MLGRQRRNKTKEVPPISLSKCLAKTVNKSENPIAGMNVVEHCLLVGSIARELVNRIPPVFKSELERLSAEVVAAVHDIGKISPSFQEKIYASLGKRLGLASGIDDDNAIGGHTVIGRETLLKLRKDVAEIVGRHHGYRSPEGDGACAEKYGGKAWHIKRLRAVAFLERELGKKLPRKIPYEYREVLCGLTTLSDWIASGGVFETMTSIPLEKDLLSLTKDAVDKAGFILPKIRNDLSFEDIFGFSPNPLQKAFCELVDHPGVYFLEAPMGMGKTEAALYAAYRLLEKGLATGIYFALPTQFTSEQMFSRMRFDFLDKILDSERKDLFLLHSLAWLVETDLGEDGSVGGSWFADNKRKILFPHAVGTIDQALLGVLNVRHSPLRIFGLYGKVVILDEVHSYDAYTFVFITRLIDILSRLGCTVFLLSATLTSKAKKRLVGLDCSQDAGECYPAISVVRDKEIRTIPVHFPGRELDVRIEFPSDEDAFDMAIESAYAGGQVIWIENTVAQAQEVYKRLSACVSDEVEVGLVHSRFIKPHRKKKEDYWVDLLGKGAGLRRYSAGRILVGTQVLEQSIDVDADLIISRLAPSDMLIQRMGRLWRHRIYDENRKVKYPVFAVLCPRIIEEGCFGPSQNIYPSYILARSLLVWKEVELLRLPYDIKKVLNETYADRKEEDALLNRWKEEWEKKSQLLETKAGNVTSPILSGISDDESWTRYSEVQFCDALILRGFKPDKGTIVLLNDDLREEVVDIVSARQMPKHRRKEVARKLMMNMVKVPAWMTPAMRDYEDWFSDFIYTKGGVRPLLLGKDNELLNLQFVSPRNDGILLYDDVLGFRFLRK